MISQFLARFAIGQADCDAEKARKFLGFLPRWYEHLQYTAKTFWDGSQHCEIQLANSAGHLDFQQLWVIGLTAIDILLRIGGLVAVGFIIYGGFRYITSQGEPENTRAAQGTVVNALIGLGITIIAASIVSFIAGRLGG